jgi:hypothetical protein
MDRQYQYVPINPSDRYGFLPYHPGDWIDPVAEEGITSLRQEQRNNGMMEYWIQREKQFSKILSS